MDGFVAQSQQVPRGVPGRAAVVYPHPGLARPLVARGGLDDRRHRDAGRHGVQRGDGRPVVGNDQQGAGGLDGPLDHVAHLLGRTGLDHAHAHGQSCRSGGLLDTFQGSGRAVQTSVGHQDRDRLHGTAGQRPGGAVRAKAEPSDSLEDLVAGRRFDLGAPIDDAGHRLVGDACGPGDVPDAHGRLPPHLIDDGRARRRSGVTDHSPLL